MPGSIMLNIFKDLFTKISSDRRLLCWLKNIYWSIYRYHL